MRAKASLGIDFGSTGYRAAIVMNGQVVTLPTGPLGEDYPVWITLDQAMPVNGGYIQFPSIKYCLDKAQPVHTLAGSATSVNLVVHILEEIRTLAEFYSDGSEIGQTVIAVPATYSEARRATLLAAAKKAGLEQTSLLNDAMATLLNFSLQHSKDSVSLIYDAGYTQCEIAILSQTRRQFHALAYGSTDRPCGRILDDSILTGCIKALQERGLQNFQPQDWLHLQRKAQMVKEKLNHMVDVHLLTIRAGNTKEFFYISFRQPRFEALVEQWMRDTFAVIENTLREANLTLKDISQVIVTGGTTKLKVVQKSLRWYFAGRSLQTTTDDAIARGAAAFAADLIGVKEIDSGSANPKEDVNAATHIGVDFLSPEEVKQTTWPPLNLNLEAERMASPAKTPVQGMQDEIEQQLQAMTSTTPRRNWRIQKAYKLLEQGKFWEAVDESHLALTSNADNYQVLADMIDIHRRAAENAQTIEQYEEAIRLLNCARSHDQTDLETLNLIAERHLLHARQLFERQDFARALNAVKSCLTVDRGNLAALELRKTLTEKLRTAPGT